MTHLRHLWAVLITSLLYLTPAQAQSPQELAQLDPSDLYFQAWLHVRDAGKLEKQKKYLEAFDKYQQAQMLFNTLAVNHPSYKAELVSDRQKTTKDSIQAIHSQALAEQKKKKEETKDFVEGPGTAPPVNVVPSRINRNAPSTRNLDRLQEDIRNLKAQLANALNDRDANAAKLRRTIKELEAERAREASSAIRSQLDRYKREINQLRRENEAMSMSLRDTRAKYKDSLQQLELTQRALAESRSKEKELRAIIKEQGKVNSRVVKGQQDQIDELREKIQKKNKLHAQALAQINQLKVQLEQSQSMAAELQEERDGLVKERDHMAALLKVGSGDRIQTLINQNVSLSKELNEAKRRVDILQSDDATTKDQLLEAKNALVIAKHKILNLQKETKAQKISIHDLRKRLTLAEADLVQSADAPEISARARQEIEMLQDIIQKQKAHMEIQETTGRLLLAQIERMGQKDKTMAQTVDQFEGTFKPALTAEEEQIVEDAGLGFVITERIQVSPDERDKANRSLQGFKGGLSRVAKRLFAKKDFQAARGNFEMIIEEDPGAWKAMVNLGVVHMNLNDPAEAAEQFRQAILVAGNRQIPYAHFMLGVAYKNTELYEDAELEFRTAIKLNPDNAKAHVFLGNIAGNRGNLEEAEVLFKEAIKIDARMHDAHMNLAHLRLLQKKRKEALKHYEDALKLGAAPNVALEKALRK